jgi:hypothetical protein
VIAHAKTVEPAGSGRLEASSFVEVFLMNVDVIAARCLLQAVLGALGTLA